MAQTILEQILENVRQGALVPALADSPAYSPSAAEIDRVAAWIVTEFENDLDEALASLTQACRRSGAATVNIQRELVEFLQERLQSVVVTCTESPLRAQATRSPDLLDHAPEHLHRESAVDGEVVEPSPQHQALRELQEVLATTRAEKQQRDPRLVQELDGVAREVNPEPLGRERNHEALADIHKMIEFLK